MLQYLGPMGICRANRANQIIGVWLSSVERLVRDQEAAGSNPVTPTRRVGKANSKSLVNVSLQGFLFCCEFGLTTCLTIDEKTRRFSVLRIALFFVYCGANIEGGDRNGHPLFFHFSKHQPHGGSIVLQNVFALLNDILHNLLSAQNKIADVLTIHLIGNLAETFLDNFFCDHR